MDMAEKKTPPKTCSNKLLETVQSKLNCDSPFRFLPNISTPPNRFTKIFNPFEPHLTERLHLPVFSPSVFKKDVTIKTEEKFKWTIEDISSLKPADIDESSVEQLSEHDPELELTAQAKIEKFFSEKHIVPSPFTAIKSVPLISDSMTPVKEEKRIETSDGIAQTILSLPPVLPDHVQAILNPYFTYIENQQQGEVNPNSTLYRQLFDRDPDSPSSVMTSPAPSCNLSPIVLSPYDSNKTGDNQRNFGSPQDVHNLPDCNLSPIQNDSPTIDQPRAQLNYSNYMSMDMSSNVVPDCLDAVSHENLSLAFVESFHSPPTEPLSDSTVNWEMEYRHISLASTDSADEMDVSNSNTPKSRYFSSQRKKLSDSFANDEAEDMHERRNIKNLFPNETTADAGYQTGGLNMEDECWESHLFASTPTKTKAN